jgi:cytoskeleton protein RodZ
MDPQARIGEALRRRREERGLTAEQAALGSKVPIRLVQVLESDDYHLLPDPLYLVRLLHEYATFLGLDVAILDAEFQQVIQRPPRMSLAVAPAPAPAPPIPWKQVFWTVAAILVVTPLVLIALSLASKRADDQALQIQAVEPRTEDAVPAGGVVAVMPDRVLGASAPSESPAAVAALDTTTAQNVGTPEAVPALGQGAVGPKALAGHILIARAQEPTWMSVSADRKESREILLQVGQTARFEATTGFHIAIGNAGGVTLTLDGTPLPALGRSGEVIRNLVLPLPRRDSPSSGAASEAQPR